VVGVFAWRIKTHDDAFGEGLAAVGDTDPDAAVFDGHEKGTFYVVAWPTCIGGVGWPQAQNCTRFPGWLLLSRAQPGERPGRGVARQLGREIARKSRMSPFSPP
jgi:hypothetical protein